MKKRFLSLLVFIAMLPFSLTLTACGHEHSFAEEWTADETHHWHIATCKHEEEKQDYLEHDYTDEYDVDCNTCGAVRVAPADMWDGKTTSVPKAIDGVITVTTAEQLAGLAKAVREGNSFKGKTIKLGADINLNNKEWTPIGHGTSNGLGQLEGDAKAFDGTFDGQNHTIYNLRITRFVGGGLVQEDVESASSGVALFGHARGVVKNITVDTATVIGNHYVAAVVGFSIGAEIENCHAKNVFVSCLFKNSEENGDKAGAVIAHLQNHDERSASIKNCSAKNSTVNANRDAGQVIGCISTNEYSGVTEASYNKLSATDVIVTDNNGIQDLLTTDNIKNQPVGRIRDYRI